MLAFVCSCLLRADAILIGSTASIHRLFVIDDAQWSMHLVTSSGVTVDAGGLDMLGGCCSLTQTFVVPFLGSGPSTISGVTTPGVFFTDSIFTFTVDPFTFPGKPGPGQTFIVISPFVMSGTLTAHSGAPFGPILYSLSVTGSGNATFFRSAMGSTDNGTIGYDFVFTPEPSTLALTFGGCLLVIGASRRRQRQSLNSLSGTRS